MGQIKRTLDHLLGIPALRLLSSIRSSEEPHNAPKLPKRLLIIKLAAMGDTILLIPVLRALRQALPNTQIDWLISRTNKDLATTVPYVNQIHVLDSFGPLSLMALSSKLKASHYDCVIDFEQWAKGTAILAWLTKAPIRIGYKTQGQERDRLFTRSLEKTYDKHELDDFFALAELLVPLSKDKTLELWETDAGRKSLESAAPSLISSGTKKRVLLHPGCGEGGKPREWPIERYKELAHWLQKTYNAEIIISGGPDDRSVADELSAGISGAHHIAGRVSWQGMVSLMTHVDYVVSGNTGVMHLAAAMKRPQVALHGPTNVAIWGPLNEKAVVLRTSCPDCPCLRLGFEYHRLDQSCMARIPLKEVQDAIHLA